MAKSVARSNRLPKRESPGTWPCEIKANIDRQVTPGWPVSNVANDPSAFCCVANQSSARLTAVSTRRHSSGERTLAGVLALARAAGGDVAVTWVVLESNVC